MGSTFRLAGDAFAKVSLPWGLCVARIADELTEIILLPHFKRGMEIFHRFIAEDDIFDGPCKEVTIMWESGGKRRAVVRGEMGRIYP